MKLVVKKNIWYRSLDPSKKMASEYFFVSPLLVTYTYNTTPIMSTYLLAFCVGDYDFLESKTKSGIIVRVYTNKGESAQGQFAVEGKFYKKN